jgi:hypothetical protein
MLKQDLLGGHEEFEGGRVKEESWGVKKQDLDAASRQFTCSHIEHRLYIFVEARYCHSPTTVLSRYGSCRLLFWPRGWNSLWKSPISDDRRERIKSATGPTHYPAKCVPELEKRWELCTDSGGECIEGYKSY